ncbi:MAG: fibronectin type III domain-containing protein, partial [Desulfuromonadales bacterium]|nr:fibronectin type III domain-containing protein [Desulfuromonadales bacterium]
TARTTNLRAEAGDARVSLKWDAPELPDDMELIGYNLYRRHAKRAFPIIPVNKDPLQETQLLDRGLDNGKAYEYRVSALIKTGDRVIESMASPGALITPQ